MNSADTSKPEDFIPEPITFEFFTQLVQKQFNIFDNIEALKRHVSEVAYDTPNISQGFLNWDEALSLKAYEDRVQEANDQVRDAKMEFGINTDNIVKFLPVFNRYIEVAVDRGIFYVAKLKDPRSGKVKLSLLSPRDYDALV
jgi:hypothetical protein